MVVLPMVLGHADLRWGTCGMPCLQRPAGAGPGEQLAHDYGLQSSWQAASAGLLGGPERQPCGQPQLPSAAVPTPLPSWPALSSPCIAAEVGCTSNQVKPQNHAKLAGSARHGRGKTPQ